MPKKNGSSLIKKQEKIQEGYITTAFIQFFKDSGRDIPDGIIGSIITRAQQKPFTSDIEVRELLDTLFETYDKIKATVRLVDAED